MQFSKFLIFHVQFDFPIIDENIFFSSIDSCNINFPVFSSRIFSFVSKISRSQKAHSLASFLQIFILNIKSFLLSDSFASI